MGKKILTAITILLISGLLAGWYLFTREAKYFGTSAFRAIPENVSVIVRIHAPGPYAARSLNNPVWKAYSELPGISGLYRQLVFADSVLNTYAEVKNLLTNKELTMMFDAHDSQHANLCVLELASLAEKRGLAAFMEDFFSRKGANAEKVKAGRANITCYSWTQDGVQRKYLVTFYRGLFLCANDREMISQAIYRLETDEDRGNPVFEKASKTATENVDMNIYINHRRLPEFSRPMFSETFLKKLGNSSPLAEWSEIDLIQKNDELLLNGFSFTPDSLNHYLGIFRNQQPGNYSLADFLPAETSMFMCFLISNLSQFFGDYEKLLLSQNQLGSYKEGLRKTDSLYHIDLQKLVTNHTNRAVALVFTQPDSLVPRGNKFLILGVHSGSEMEQALIPLTMHTGIKSKKGIAPNFTLYRIDNETVFKIYQSSVSDFGKQVFGEVFSDVVTNYFTIYDNFLIMGNSYESLGRFVRTNVLKETLGNNKAYRDFIAGLSGSMNFLLWSSPGRALPFCSEILKPELYAQLEGRQNELRKIESFAWQIGTENGMIYNMARLKYNPHETTLPQEPVVWKSYLGYPVINQPQFVINPADKLHPEIVLQDSEYNLILLSYAGRVIWKIKLQEPIRGNIYQLDNFRNGRGLFFFNTDQALHLIDHEGNYLQNYPLALRSQATNQVSVFDYDNKGDYRFFIACKDHKVYLYDKNGRIIPDWVSPRTEHDVISPVQHFRVGKKDYIVFADQGKGYILDRKGKNSVSIKGEISYSQNPFTFVPAMGKNPPKLVTTDSKGTIVSIGFDGSVRRLPTGAFSPGHYFLHADINSDNKGDYIILDGDSLAVYDQQATLIFSRKFAHKTDLPPRIVNLPDKRKLIGVVDKTENLIYLVNGDGSNFKGFPREGNSAFASGFTESGIYGLITGTPDGFVINYQVK